MKYCIDPPYGHEYGFPVCVDYKIGNNKQLIEILEKNNYPRELIPLAMLYTRYWTIGDEDMENFKYTFVIFLGGCTRKECLEDRKKIKKTLNEKFNNIYIIDPYRENWTYEYIYDEVLSIIRSDFTLFYKPGRLSMKEMEIASELGRDYMVIDKLEDLERVVKYIQSAYKNDVY